MQEFRQLLSEIDRTILQTGRREPNRALPSDYLTFDAWRLPRDNRFVATDSDADPDIGLWGPPRDHSSSSSAQFGRQAAPAPIR